MLNTLVKPGPVRSEAEEAIIALAANDEAAAILAQTGLPTQRIEDWHYTDLRTRLKSVPAAINGSLQVVAPEAIEVTGAPAEFRKVSGDFIRSINAALTTDGATISVPAGYKDEAAIEITVLRPENANIHIRNQIKINRTAQVTIKLHNMASDDAAAFTSMVSDIVLEQGAELTIVSISHENALSTQLGQMNFILGENARLTCLMMNEGGETLRTELIAEFTGEHSHADFYGINLATGNELADIRLKLDHAVPNTTSVEKFRCVVAGEGHSVFQGAIRVAPDAQKTDANMMTRGLLLSETAQFSAKPELEIFADDVLCAHGATSGNIDQDALFYLMARGIPEHEAMMLMVNAFVDELLDDVGNEALTYPLRERVSNWLSHVETGE